MHIPTPELFPKIHNLKAILQDHPDYHPDSKKYLDYWREQKKRCIEGYWYQDLPGQWRYCPPHLYFYANMGTIVETDHNTKARKKTRPFIRDVEWIIYTAYLACRGFSGFEEDKEFTCNRAVKDDIEDMLTPNCYTPKNELKKYIPAVQYLKQLYDKPLGRPLYENDAQNLFLLGSRGLGKDLIWDTIIHKEEGADIIDNIKIGDKIYGKDGKLTTVTNRFDFDDQEQFEVTLSDGRKVTSGKGHLWGVYNRRGKGSKSIYEVKELGEILKDYKQGVREDSRYFVPQNEALQYTPKDYKIDPYLLGCLLGDGGMTSKNITLTSADKDLVDICNSKLEEGYEFRFQSSSRYGYILRKKKTNTAIKNNYNTYLTDLGLLYHHTRDKFIPEIYLKGSVEQRLELLQGLLDTDGHCTESGNIEFVTISKQLAKDVTTLCRSLGIVVKSSEDGYKSRLYLKTDLIVFKLKRKIERLNIKPSKYTQTNRSKLAIRDIKSVGIQKSVCISVDNQDSLFLVNDFVVTHNSYTVGHAILSELLFDGAKYYDSTTITNPNKVEIFVGAFKADKSSELLSKVHMALSELPGTFGKNDTYRPSPFYKEMSGTLKVGNTKSAFEHLYKKKENGNWVTAGTGSKVIHEIFTTENPQAAAGGRAGLLVIEEVGLLQNLKDVHGANIPTQITDGRKFGTSVYIGTGGNMEKIVESEYLFRRPSEYDILGFEDEFENTGEIGLFIPVQYTYNDLKDENGNTKFELANKRVVNERKNKKWDALQHQKTNYPIIPSEMFMNDRSNIFPIYEIQKQIKFLITNKKRIDNFTNYGNLIYDMDSPNGVSFTPDVDSSIVPITDYPTKKGINLRGAITIYEHPPEIIPKGLYKVVYDPVRDENIDTMSKGVSLAAIYVYKTIQRFDGVFDQLVAHYVGRTQNTDDIHETALKLAQYYGTKVFVEMNLPGFYKYCIHARKLHMLESTPMLTIGKVVPNGKQRYNVGMYMSETLKIQGEQYLNRWLLQIRDVEYDEIGNILREKRNIDYIYDKALLEELLQYNRVLNTDRISAMFLLMYLVEEAKEKPQVTDNAEPSINDAVSFMKQTFSKKKVLQPQSNRTLNFPTLYG